MIRRISLIALLAAFSTSSCQKERESKGRDETPKELPKNVKVADVAISSVSISEDCPDTEPKAASNAKAAPSEDMGVSAEEMDSDSEYGGMPCSQSSMQLAITGQGNSSSQFGIVAIRLLGPKGEFVGTLEPRLPKIWKAKGYAAWDQIIMPKTDVKASYKLALPNWSEVQDKIEGSTYNTIFRLEVDIFIGSVPRILRSSEFVREQSGMVDT
jgi:hypothetical protein